MDDRDPEGPDPEDLDDLGDDETSDTAICPACGAETYEDAPRCAACGRYVTPQRSPARRTLWAIVLALLAAAAIMWRIIGC